MEDSNMSRCKDDMIRTSLFARFGLRGTYDYTSLCMVKVPLPQPGHIGVIGLGYHCLGNDLAPTWHRQPMTWLMTTCQLRNCDQIQSKFVYTRKTHLKISSTKWKPSWSGPHVFFYPHSAGGQICGIIFMIIWRSRKLGYFCEQLDTNRYAA